MRPIKIYVTEEQLEVLKARAGTVESISSYARRMLLSEGAEPRTPGTRSVLNPSAEMPTAPKPKLMSALPYPHEHPCFLSGEEKHRQCLRCCICGKK